MRLASASLREAISQKTHRNAKLEKTARLCLALWNTARNTTPRTRAYSGGFPTKGQRSAGKARQQRTRQQGKRVRVYRRRGTAYRAQEGRSDEERKPVYKRGSLDSIC